jgi:hypothetical protein
MAMDTRWIENMGSLARTLGRLVCGAGLLVGMLVLTAPAAHADNCSSLEDCFYTASTAAQVVAALAIVLAAAVLALPALLRGARGPAELSDARLDAEGQTAGQGSGQGGQRIEQSGQPQTLASGGTSDGGSNQGLNLPNLPNLPDTPDVPLTPEVAGMMGAQEAEAEETGRAREYTPQALEQMRALGVSAADVEAVIQSGSASAGSEPGTTVYASSGGLRVLVEATSGRVLDMRR